METPTQKTQIVILTENPSYWVVILTGDKAKVAIHYYEDEAHVDKTVNTIETSFKCAGIKIKKTLHVDITEWMTANQTGEAVTLKSPLTGKLYKDDMEGNCIRQLCRREGSKAILSFQKK